MAESDSDLEDAEPYNDQVLGNVSDFVALPPDHAGSSSKRGFLVFDASFESGNLGRVDYISEYEYDIFIRPDTCNPRFRIWFNFTVRNVKANQRAIFNIVNFSKTKSLYREGMTPVVKSSSRSRWQRIPAKSVYYYKCPDHRRSYVMSFVFCFDRENDIYQFSYCYPYTYTDLQNYLDSIEEKNFNFFHRELLATSEQQRRLDLLTITNPENLVSDQLQKVVFVTSRVHPGETPASFVCQGLIDFLISPHPVARILREYVVFKIIPMLNPDGVFLGNYRSSLMGFDLNRVWQNPSPWAHPGLFAVKNYITELDSDPRVELEFYIDIHAHSTMMNGFMYGNVFDDAGQFERQMMFPKLLCGNAEDFSMLNTNYNRDVVKAGTGRRTLGGLLEDHCYCYTLEVSFFSYTVSGCNQIMPYTDEAYMRLGRNLARTFLDYYKLVNHIPIKPGATLTPRLATMPKKTRKGSVPNGEENRRRPVRKSRPDMASTAD